MFKAVLFGAGSIGALKPDKLDVKENPFPITHAHAIFKNPDVELFGIVDPDEKKGREAAIKWGTQYFSSLSELEITGVQIDIVVVAVQTHLHYFVMNQILKLKPKIVICEKPFCQTKDETIKIISFYKTFGIPIVVNYGRRFVKELFDFAAEIKSGLFGRILFSSFIYTRGLIRDGSHAIDILRLFFGPFLNGWILDGESFDDYSKEDLSFPAFLSFDKCKNTFLVPADGRNFSIFELSILTEKGKIEFKDHFKKVYFFNSSKEKIYGNFKSIEPEYYLKTEISLEKSLINLYKEVVDFLNKKINEEDFSSTAENALAVHQILKTLLTGEKCEK